MARAPKAIFSLFVIFFCLFVASVKGLQRDILTKSEGRTVNADNTVIRDQHITGSLIISAKNVRIRNCIIECSGQEAAIDVSKGFDGLELTDVEISGAQGICRTGIRGGNWKGKSVEIHDVFSGVLMESNSQLIDSHIHHLSSPDAQAAGIFIEGGDELVKNIRIAGTIIESHAAAIRLVGKDFEAVFIEANTIRVDDGPSVEIISPTLLPNTKKNAITVNGNRFASKSIYRPTIPKSPFLTASNNLDERTGDMLVNDYFRGWTPRETEEEFQHRLRNVLSRAVDTSTLSHWYPPVYPPIKLLGQGTGFWIWCGVAGGCVLLFGIFLIYRAYHGPFFTKKKKKKKSGLGLEMREVRAPPPDFAAQLKAEEEAAAAAAAAAAKEKEPPPLVPESTTDSAGNKVESLSGSRKITRSNSQSRTETFSKKQKEVEKEVYGSDDDKGKKPIVDDKELF